jgi:G3E family GTPase
LSCVDAQVAIADVLVASKADLATPVHLSAFDAWAKQLFPRKQHVHKATHGDIDVALLDIPFDDVHQPLLRCACLWLR